MALIKCSECGREISDKAAACPGCGAPICLPVTNTPTLVSYDRASDAFNGTPALMAKLAIQAVHHLGWKLNGADAAVGLVTFETGMSWGSWSGVSCSLSISEVGPNTFKVSGTGKQNIRGGQLIALNIGGEAQSKARQAIETMKELAFGGGMLKLQLIAGQTLSSSEMSSLASAAAQDRAILACRSRINGNSLLHAACEANLLSVVEQLVRLGADTSSGNGNGKKPFELAKDSAVRSAAAPKQV